MSYEDEIKDLQAKIRLEQSRRKSLPKSSPPHFESPAELVSFLRSIPIQKPTDNITLSNFLRRFRAKTGIELDDVALALNLPSELLKELESRSTLPWTLSPSAMAQLACMYRLHVHAIERLVRNSYHIATVSERIADPHSAETLISIWLREVRLDLEQRGADDLVK